MILFESFFYLQQFFLVLNILYMPEISLSLIELIWLFFQASSMFNYINIYTSNKNSSVLLIVILLFSLRLDLHIILWEVEFDLITLLFLIWEVALVFELFVFVYVDDCFKLTFSWKFLWKLDWIFGRKYWFCLEEVLPSVATFLIVESK